MQAEQDRGADPLQEIREAYRRTSRKRHVTFESFVDDPARRHTVTSACERFLAVCATDPAASARRLLAGLRDARDRREYARCLKALGTSYARHLREMDTDPGIP